MAVALRVTAAHRIRLIGALHTRSRGPRHPPSAIHPTARNAACLPVAVAWRAARCPDGCSAATRPGAAPWFPCCARLPLSPSPPHHPPPHPHRTGPHQRPPRARPPRPPPPPPPGFAPGPAPDPGRLLALGLL